MKGCFFNLNKMKKISFLILLLCFCSNSFAHFLWIETNGSGKINQSHDVKIFFGEYTYGVNEKVGEEAFNKVKNFTVWAVAPNGEKTKLNVEAGDLFYKTSFVPKTNGTYTIVLNNNEIDVVDYTQYNFGIFKTHYHCIAKVEVGSKANETVALNPEGITLVDVSKKQHAENGEVVLKVLYKDQILKDKEVDLFVKDLWTKKVQTDANGLIKFNLPWNTKYIVEVTNKEEVPGKYNGKDYQFVWHSSTYTIILK